MKNYEITFITRENLSEKPFKDLLDSLSGNILSISSTGEHQFVYPIKKETRGVYTTVLFELDPSKLSDLNRKLSLNDEILRFLIIAKKASAMAALAEAGTKAAKAEIAAPAEIESEKMIAEPKELPVIDELPEPKKVAKPKVVKEKPVIDEPKVITPKPEKKAESTPELSEEDRLKELDKKLDELLKD